jgi:casein kinase II subunit alpha
MNIKPRLYADANIKKGPQYFDYDNYEISYG